LDIEPANAAKLVKTVTVSDNVMAYSRGRALSISDSEDSTVDACDIASGNNTTVCDITINNNIILGSNTEQRADAGFAMNVSATDISFIGNTFFDIDATGIGQKIELFKFHGAENLLLQNNTFDEVYWDWVKTDEETALLYFKGSDAIETTELAGNSLENVSLYPEASQAWCWVDDSAPTPPTFNHNVLRGSLFYWLLPDCSLPF
jgi:hypothetical protein